MYRTLPYLGLFAAAALLQVFLFDNLTISIYLNPLVYIVFIALLPLDTPPAAVLGAGLALGVTMDFSIFLLHRYQEEKELRSSNEEAMTSAICKTMTSISASSLTTIAGFLALCAMRLTLGRDIGLVMAKGVALGVIDRKSVV